jgi:hypothetical protein
MKAHLTILLAALLLPSLAGAKGSNTRIEVTQDGAPLASITDGNILNKLTFWSGPGTTMQPAGQPARMSTSTADIADWMAGPVPPPVETRVYEVSFFFAVRPHNGAGERSYTVRYVPAAAGPGFIQIPGKDSPHYRSNVSLIIRGVEGNWYRASARWEELVRPAIDQARVTAR